MAELVREVGGQRARRLTLGHHPASTNTMIIEVSALRGPSPQGASDSSVDDAFAKTSSALESDVPCGEGPRRDEPSIIIVFVLVG